MTTAPKLIAQDTAPPTAEIYSKNLGQFGVPLRKAVGCPLNGFSASRIWAEGCMGWIWLQWMAQTSPERIRKEVDFVIDRGMEMQDRCPAQDYRALHDLWLLHCAIMVANRQKLLRVAERVIDSKGDTRPNSHDKTPPRNNGELFAAAWCGMIKYRILGDEKKVTREFDAIWDKYRYDIARTAPKPLVVAWLDRAWPAFRKQQQKDFKALWDRASKDGILSEKSPDLYVFDFHRQPVPGRGWCWSHCGLAMLAHREGHEVAVESFWLPVHALNCVPQEMKQKSGNDKRDSPQ